MSDATEAASIITRLLNAFMYAHKTPPYDDPGCATCALIVEAGAWVEAVTGRRP